MDEIRDFLLALGMRPTQKGFNACMIAIELVMKDITYAESVVHKLYPEVARRTESNAASVEKAIRDSVSTMVSTKKRSNYVKMLQMEPRSSTGSYSNTEFITLCAYALRRKKKRRGDPNGAD